MPGRCQAVFDTHGGADFIESVLATGLPVLCCEAVGKLRTVVGQQFDDPDPRGQLEPAQRSTLLLLARSTRDGVLGRRQTARFDLVVGSGSDEIAAPVPGTTPKSQHSMGFHRFKTMSQEGLSY